MMDFSASLAEFAGASELLKPSQGVTSLEQLVRETNRKEKEKKNQEEKQERAARESLESRELEHDLVVPDIASGALPADATVEPDKPEPEALQQCLFPELAEAAEPLQLEDCDLRQAGADVAEAAAADTEGGDHASSDEAAQLAQQDAVRQLLVGGMLPAHCRATGSCSVGIAQELFRLMTSTDMTVATASFDAFVSILGQQSAGDRVAQPMTVDATSVAEFDSQRAGECSVGWLPGDDALLAALHGCGYHSPGAAGDAKPMKSPSKGSDGGKRPPKGKIVAQKRSRTGMPVSGEGDVVLSQPLLARLRLLLRFIPALVHYDEEHDKERRRGGLRAAGLQRLVAAMLRLRLDPAAAALGSELQASIEALLRAWPSKKEWQAALPALAAEVSKLGPSHRAHLAVMNALPTLTPRGKQLQAAAATLLLHRLVPPLPKSKAHPAPPSLLDIDAQEVVQRLWWQEHTGETKRAAQASFKGGARFDVYELDTAVRLANLLLWNDTLGVARRANAGEQRQGDAERAKYIKGSGWHTTLRAIHNELRNIGGGWQVPTIRLAGYVDYLDQRNRLTLQSQLG